ncbi:hypothetical protein GCM10010503_64390 [Streptomyces lucensis JCM 4490]|uniref:DUF4253 domain-containing protein n=1 Tax=Streptomyces lucensis JCM 4490 TaxID=1306176 RepID=A0A918JIL0_9ACTN|nr:DUF4253 domain-containing protein [Streptomyces lucensis]GGW77704.1 hypothetical protein GCM10010503_64390 [Streptomyces lucensis JCM 4490]
MATLPNPLPRLATDPSGRSLGLQLPPGRLVDTTDGARREPLLWYADKQAAPGTWAALAAPAARAGLLPVLVDLGGVRSGPADWELMPDDMSYPGDHDPEEVLAEYWEDEDDEDGFDEELAETLAPFGPAWPGLAPAGTLTVDPGTCAARLADSLAEETWFKDPRPALVPSRRSADIPAAIGWTGPLNHDNDVARLCAVLRSWEDRFGIRVVALGFDVLAVSVAAPPTTLAGAEAVAAEHFAFCPDNFARGGDLRAYAKELIGEHSWYFWWD